LQRENTISEHLRDLLDVYPKVKISGIGVFSINTKPAWIDATNKELYPPTKTLSILEDSLEGIDFIQGVNKLLGDRSTDIKKIQDTINFYSSELDGKGKIHIEGVGELAKGPNGQISLVDVHPSWGEGTTYLPVLPLSPVAQLNKPKETPFKKEITAVAKQKTRATPTSTRGVWKQSILPLIVLGGGVCFLLWYFSKRTPDSTNTSDIEVVTDTLGNNALYQDSVNIINAKYQGLLTPEVLAEGCKIVVGSYKQKANAQTQSSRISELGYHVQMSTSDAGYRVLIVFDCKNYNLKSYLKTIKSEVTPNAWYLSPEIKTEAL